MAHSEQARTDAIADREDIYIADIAAAQLTYRNQMLALDTSVSQSARSMSNAFRASTRTAIESRDSSLESAETDFSSLEEHAEAATTNTATPTAAMRRGRINDWITAGTVALD